MSLPDIAQYGLFLVVVLLLVKPLGGYMMRVFTGQKTFLDSVFVPVERTIYRLTGIDANRPACLTHRPVQGVLPQTCPTRRPQRLSDVRPQPAASARRRLSLRGGVLSGTVRPIRVAADERFARLACRGAVDTATLGLAGRSTLLSATLGLAR